MRLVRLANWLYPKLRAMADKRPPDFIIGPNYCRRWWIIPRNPIFNIYLHQFLHSDDDRALHDHPWFNLSFLLKGIYIEHVPGESSLTHPPTMRKGYWAGHIKLRMAHSPHRIELLTNSLGNPGEVWSLFITGPVIRRWGFHCPNGWRHWKEFVDSRDKGQIGRGCD